MTGVLALLGIVAVGVCGGLLVVRRQFVSVGVVGRSMEPGYRSGDRVLVRRVPAAAIRVGDVVVVERPDTDGRWPATPIGAHPDDRDWFLKRVAAVPGDPVPAGSVHAPTGPGDRIVPPGKVVLLGDDPSHSYDSRHIGYFPLARVLGRVARTSRPS